MERWRREEEEEEDSEGELDVDVDVDDVRGRSKRVSAAMAQ